MALIGPEELTDQIIGGAIEVHRALGPGLLESVYRVCLMQELKLRGYVVQTEVNVPLSYKGVELNCGYRIDLMVEEEVIVELKSVSMLQPIHTAQLLTYLKLMDKKLGLLINFNTPLLKDGLRRIQR